MAQTLSVAELSITGMHCTSCAALVEETVGELDGVSGVEVVYESGRAKVTFDAAAVGVEELCAAVAEAGYEAHPADTADMSDLTAAASDPERS